MKRSFAMVPALASLILTWIMLCHTSSAAASVSIPDALIRALASRIGPRDAVMVSTPDGSPLMSIQADQSLVPASILKVFTALAALRTMGPDYRYITEFYSDDSQDLIIKGYGDPLLISERLDAICARLAQTITQVRNVTLDNTFFCRSIVIPGRGSSTQPYDAPNGALCVNFNTVAFQYTDGQWISDEPQTPLLPVVMPKVIASGLTAGRITLAADSVEALQYTGELFKHFLTTNGIEVQGSIGSGSADRRKHHLLWRYHSLADLSQVVAKLLEFSNNFIANQLLLTMGAHVHGPPATMEKGLKVLDSFYRQDLGLGSGTIAEASGISRLNRITAREMMVVLERFMPFHQLMRHSGRQYYKTGHLKGVRSRAGYLTSRHGGRYRFVVIINSPGKSTRKIMRIIESHLE